MNGNWRVNRQEEKGKQNNGCSRGNHRSLNEPIFIYMWWLLFSIHFYSFFSSFFTAHEEMRKLIETMPHPTRVDSLSWKLKYFYESCTALEHIVVPEQKLIRVIDQMGNPFLFLCPFSGTFHVWKWLKRICGGFAYSWFVQTLQSRCQSVE